MHFNKIYFQLIKTVMLLYAACCLVSIVCSINSDIHSILTEFGSSKVVNFVDHIKQNKNVQM